MKTVFDEVVTAMGGEEELSTPAPTGGDQVLPGVTREVGGSIKSGVVQPAADLKVEGDTAVYANPFYTNLLTSVQVKKSNTILTDFMAFSILDEILIKAIRKAKKTQNERKAPQLLLRPVAVAAYYEQIKTEAKVEENREEDIKIDKIEDNTSRIRFALSKASQTIKKPVRKTIICTSVVDAYKQANFETEGQQVEGKALLPRTMTPLKAKKSTMKKLIGFTPVVAAYKQAWMKENKQNMKTIRTQNFRVRKVREGTEKKAPTLFSFTAKKISTPIVEAYQQAIIDANITTEFVEGTQDGSEAQEDGEGMRDASTAADTEELEEDAELWNLALNCDEMAVNLDDGTASDLIIDE